MPARYWLELPQLREPAAVEHLHAALSSWFDGAPGAPESTHHDVVKPYSISPASRHRGVWGIEIGTLTDAAAQEVERRAGAARVRLGTVTTMVGRGARLSSTTWAALAAPDGATRWEVDFITPFTYRTGKRTSPFPAPAVVLRNPAVAWQEFSGESPLKSPLARHDAVWVSDLNVHTESYVLKGRRYSGLLGRVTYRCDDPEIAPTVSTLLRLAEYTGVGSFRGKGMGIVTVRSR